MIRCEWGDTSPLYQQYHDEEWGVPLHNDQALFEFLILKGQYTKIAQCRQ